VARVKRIGDLVESYRHRRKPIRDVRAPTNKTGSSPIRANDSGLMLLPSDPSIPFLGVVPSNAERKTGRRVMHQSRSGSA
jgi:hypothetical protein